MLDSSSYRDIEGVGLHACCGAEPGEQDCKQVQSNHNYLTGRSLCLMSCGRHVLQLFELFINTCTMVIDNYMYAYS